MAPPPDDSPSTLSANGDADLTDKSTQSNAAQNVLDYWFGVVLAVIAVPLIVAVFSDAALTWDGAYLLFRALDSGAPFIPHDRLIDGPINWPVSWVDSVTDSLPILRAAFGVVHVVTPLIALGLSWWVVRKEAPGLIIWPLLGIGLATLPGQINFISEGIKANQLIWPILLAVLIGAPSRILPMMAIVSLVIMLLHPAAVPIFGVVAVTALVMGVLQPLNRERLFPVAICLLIASLLRYGMIAGGYQTSEMTIDTQRRQWRNSATGLPGVALSLTFVVAVVILLGTYVRIFTRFARWISLALVAVAGGALTIWAIEPVRWWDALEFRGPANVVSLTAAGFAVLDTLLANRGGNSRYLMLSPMRRATGQAIAVVFAIVLSFQSIAYSRTIGEMNDALAASTTPCLAMEDLPGMPESPLNLWSTPSLSLLYQDRKPVKIVLPRLGCESAMERGRIPLSSPGSDYVSERIDLLPLKWELGGNGECWWQEQSGWHGVERTEDDRRRWSADTGRLRIFVEESSTITFRGLITTLRIPNEIDVFVNGERQQTIEFADSNEVSTGNVSLQLVAGENIIDFVSANESAHAPGDSRDLAFSLLNVVPEVMGSSESCSLHR